MVAIKTKIVMRGDRAGFSVLFETDDCGSSLGFISDWVFFKASLMMLT